MWQIFLAVSPVESPAGRDGPSLGRWTLRGEDVAKPVGRAVLAP